MFLNKTLGGGNRKVVPQVECENLEDKAARERQEVEDLEKISGFMEEVIDSHYIHELDSHDMYVAMLAASAKYGHLYRKAKARYDSTLERIERSK